MKHFLLLGATGRLGKVVLNSLLSKKYAVTAIVRSPEKIKVEDKNLVVVKGDVVSSDGLSLFLNEIDVVVLTLGHGFRTPYLIQSETLMVLIPLLKEKGVKRIITITGAALKTREDPKSVVLSFTENLLSFVDPFRMEDARIQQRLLEKSDLDWTVVRTPVHKDGNSTVGYASYRQPYPWQRVTRKAVANFIIECIEKNEWVRKSPIFY